MTKIDSLTFPDFYAECAYHDGMRDQREGHCNSVPSYMRHGEFEPIGYGWYLRGRKAAQSGLTARRRAANKMCKLFCKRCGSAHRKLHVHHKDQNLQNNSLENLETLCPSCHKTAHNTGNL